MVTPATKDLAVEQPRRGAGRRLDGGLPRHAAWRGRRRRLAHATTTPIDFSKEVLRARPEFFPEAGHGSREGRRCASTPQPPSFKVPLTGARTAAAANSSPTASAGRRAVPRALHRRRRRAPEHRRGRHLLQRRDPHRSKAPRAARALQRAAAAQGRQHPVRRGAEQDRLPLPAAAHHHAVGRRGPGDQQAEAARAARHASQHLRLRGVFALQPRAEGLRDRRLPGAHADRHHRPAHPPAQVGPDHDRRRGQRLELRGRHALARNGGRAHRSHQLLQRLCRLASPA